MRFDATIQLHGRTATGIQVPAEIVAALGPGRRPAVRVTINGHTYRSTVAPMRSEHLLPVSADVRERAGVAAGDHVQVEVELDTQPREVAVPEDLALSLAANHAAMRAFEALSYSGRQRVVMPIKAAKTPETRHRRIARAIGELGA
jgi:Domain of unknown function (DUF1905)/Bacteriocin-protection, YdeI or OmpD-Associated